MIRNFNRMILTHIQFQTADSQRKKFLSNKRRLVNRPSFFDTAFHCVNPVQEQENLVKRSEGVTGVRSCAQRSTISHKELHLHNCSPHTGAITLNAAELRGIRAHENPRGITSIISTLVELGSISSHTRDRFDSIRQRNEYRFLCPRFPPFS